MTERLDSQSPADKEQRALCPTCGTLCVLHPLSHGRSMTPVAQSAGTRITDWLFENAMDCGDNSCMFGGRGKGGMRTNGGCRCFKELPTAKRIYVERMFEALRTQSARTSITDREPSGYAAILDDKTSSQHDGWFIGAYHSQQSAMMALAGQKSGGRTVPFYFATDDELNSMMAKAMCAHEWVSARNQAVVSGEICLKCFAVRAEENATRHTTDRNVTP